VRADDALDEPRLRHADHAPAVGDPALPDAEDQRQVGRPAEGGGIRLARPSPALFVAPMAGVTDRPFRSCAGGLGAGYAVSEMVTSRASCGTR
jgi:hypothetical protein